MPLVFPVLGACINRGAVPLDRGRRPRRPARILQDADPICSRCGTKASRADQGVCPTTSAALPTVEKRVALACQAAPQASPAQIIRLAQHAIIQASMTILDINQIRAILPHRYPFLLVDRIIEMEDDRIVGIKCVTHNEPQFTGHFPDFPVMPGVLIVEAMAQTAGILVLHDMPDRANKLVLLVAIENARFRRPVVPGDTLRMEMKILKRKASVAKMAGVATVDGVVVAEAEVMCKLADK